VRGTLNAGTKLFPVVVDSNRAKMEDGVDLIVRRRGETDSGLMFLKCRAPVAASTQDPKCYPYPGFRCALGMT